MAQEQRKNPGNVGERGNERTTGNREPGRENVGGTPGEGGGRGNVGRGEGGQGGGMTGQGGQGGGRTGMGGQGGQGGGNLTCNDCGSSFSSRDEMDRHSTSMHNR